MDPNQSVGENYANPKTCFFHVLFKAAALAFYILSALFIDNFVIIFVVTVLLAALDFWVVKNVSGRILVGLRWWNEINDLGESVWKFECLDQESLARMNKKDSWLFWWTLYITAIAWIFLAIFSLIRLQADYLLVVGVCLTLSIANIVGFTKCKKGLGALALVFICCIDIFCIASGLIDVTMEACFILNDWDGCETYTPEEFSKRPVLLRILRIVVLRMISLYTRNEWLKPCNGIRELIGFISDAKKQIQQFASQTIASRFSSTLQSAFSVV